MHVRSAPKSRAHTSAAPKDNSHQERRQIKGRLQRHQMERNGKRNLLKTPSVALGPAIRAPHRRLLSHVCAVRAWAANSVWAASLQRRIPLHRGMKSGCWHRFDPCYDQGGFAALSTGTEICCSCYSEAERNKTKQRSEQNKKSNCFTFSCLGASGQSTHFYVLGAFYLLLIHFLLQLACR